MRLPKRDIVASGAVAVAVGLYALWLAGAAPFGMSTRITGLVVLVLGFVASASAVVPGFTQLLHGGKAYLAVTSVLGLGALAAGIVTLWSADSAALAALTGLLVLLWAISTTHHVLLARSETCPACGALVQETYCEVCGYDLIRQTRADVALHGSPL
ncbi:MAG TPA: zinc ribbon domain-containing protein [Microlunatus sp.]|nr:zinc ribbon domain-containing protein [Microlunatus sp.]